MKFLSLIILFIATLVSVNAQEKPDRKALYQFIQPTKLTQCDSLGKSIDASQVFPSDYDFEIFSILPTGDLIIDIVYFTKNGSNQEGADKLNLKFRGTTDPNKAELYYLMPISIFNLAAEKEQSKWSISFGTASTLLKYRPGSGKVFQNKYPINSDIGNDFSLAALVGLQLSVNSSVNEYFLFGVNYTSIKMTPQTTQGVLTSDSNVGALTPTVAWVFEYKKIQLGLFSGLDMPTGAAGKSWVYKGRPWFGLGIGFSIFKPGSSSSDAKQPTK
ncbi:hypothetical protein [Mucilaginibacter dorajii]|uniref:Outer membrane protein beta-barrel domain-containing protein n=1 Tax=Mucilaginibacter dorajii TaxID=692994 RepID=A0ABP7Q3E1_9SPHI|nr:hypothetical protein [Mucilaginibacter dorajii]MCS3732675.1 hypothetical protein [Mucilaginibacter dorajii]